MMNLISRFRRDTSGATAIEYALIAAIVGVGIIASLTNLRAAITTEYSATSSALTKTY